MPLSLLIFIFRPTRLSSLVWRLGLVGLFPLLTSKSSLSLTLQISRNCSSFTLWSLSPCYSLLICHFSIPIWSVLAYTATSHHPFFQSVNSIFLLRQDQIGVSRLWSFFMIYFYCISFHRLLLQPVLFPFLLFVFSAHFLPFPFLLVLLNPTCPFPLFWFLSSFFFPFSPQFFFCWLDFHFPMLWIKMLSAKYNSASIYGRWGSMALVIEPFTQMKLKIY